MVRQGSCLLHGFCKNAEWLQTERSFGDDDYIILDFAPGRRVELYSHLIPIMHNLVQLLQQWGYSVVSYYLLDAFFVFEPQESYIRPPAVPQPCMMQLACATSVITKCDIADETKQPWCWNSEAGMIQALSINNHQENWKRLTSAMSSVVDDYMIVSFVMLDVTDEDSMKKCS
jgi:hypothetical protein